MRRLDIGYIDRHTRAFVHMPIHYLYRYIMWIMSLLVVLTKLLFQRVQGGKNRKILGHWAKNEFGNAYVE
jgi:archaellum biogenesis protein FlaJ (TadC family)